LGGDFHGTCEFGRVFYLGPAPKWWDHSLRAIEKLALDEEGRSGDSTTQKEKVGQKSSSTFCVLLSLSHSFLLSLSLARGAHELRGRMGQGFLDLFGYGVGGISRPARELSAPVELNFGVSRHQGDTLTATLSATALTEGLFSALLELSGGLLVVAGNDVPYSHVRASVGSDQTRAGVKVARGGDGDLISTEVAMPGDVSGETVGGGKIRGERG